MPKMIALREFRYASKQWFPGDTVDVAEKYAQTLQRIGKADYGEPANKTDLPKRATKAVEPEVAEEPAPLSGTYLRRDMQAVGQTGEDKPVQSSRRGRPRKVWNSPASEDDAE